MARAVPDGRVVPLEGVVGDVLSARLLDEYFSNPADQRFWSVDCRAPRPSGDSIARHPGWAAERLVGQLFSRPETITTMSVRYRTTSVLGIALHWRVKL